MEVGRFQMNGIPWRIRFVESNDPILIDRTNTKTVATTDPRSKWINLSSELGGNFLMQVLIHELGHCALYSYGLLDDIHRMVYPSYWIEMEELICNILADYGYQIYKIAFKSLGYHAWELVPIELDNYMKRRYAA